jgi:hypothetical protein
MNDKDRPRLAVTAALIGLFGFAVVAHYSDGLEETLKALVLLAAGYWLGSSKGSADKSGALQDITRDGIEIKQPANNPVPIKDVQHGE